MTRRRSKRTVPRKRTRVPRPARSRARDSVRIRMQAVLDHYREVASFQKACLHGGMAVADFWQESRRHPDMMDRKKAIMRERWGTALEDRAMDLALNGLTYTRSEFDIRMVDGRLVRTGRGRVRSGSEYHPLHLRWMLERLLRDTWGINAETDSAQDLAERFRAAAAAIEQLHEDQE